MVIISRDKDRKKTSFFNTLRFRIVIIMLALSIGPAIVITLAICGSYENLAISNRTAVVKAQCYILSNQLANSDYLHDPVNEAINGEIDILTSIYGGRIQVVNPNYKIIKDTFNLDRGKYMISSAVIDCFEGSEYVNYNDDNSVVEMVIPIKSLTDEESETGGVLMISFSTKEINSTYAILFRNALIVLGIIVLLIIIFGLILSSFLVKPFKKITNDINSLTLEPIHVNDYSETIQISEAFNRLLRQVNNIEDTRQEFVSNVSHELKTPLTSMKVLADSLNMNPEASLEQYKEFMKDISEEISRENAIITDLLSLVKMEKDSTSLNVEKTNINNLINLTLKRLTPIADLHHVKLISDSFRTVYAEVDPTKITLIVSNIVENAVKYNKPEGGWVRIALNSDLNYFYLTISDSGIGIPKGDTERIFDRFYRVDKSHSSDISGTGLGLAIVKSAIVAHKGAVRVSSEENEGTTFSIRIPLAYIA